MVITKVMNRNWQFFIMCALLLASLLFNFTTCNRSNAVVSGDLFTGIVKAIRDKDSAHIVTIKALELKSAQMNGLHKTNDSLLNIVISNLRRYNAVNSSVFETKYFYSDTIRSLISKYDTIVKDSVMYVYPTYRKSLANEWIKYFYEVGKDVDTFSVQFNNTISYTQYKKKEKWFQRAKTYIDIKSQNPYSTITDARTITIENKPIPLSIGLSIGYGMTSNLKPAGYIGISLNYKLIPLDFLWRIKKKKTNRDTQQ